MAQASASRLIEEKEYQHKIAKLWVWIVWLGTMVRHRYGFSAQPHYLPLHVTI